MTNKKKKKTEPSAKVVQDFSELDKAVEIDEWKIKIGDEWVKSWKPYLKTSDKSNAAAFTKKVAESYLPRIKFYRGIKGDIIKA